MAKGAVRGGVQEKRFKSGEQWEVLRREEGAVILGKDGVEKQLPLDQTRKFSVFEREKITLAIGDRHASQAKTVDQVIASVPVRAFSQANEAQFYVTMSRARWAMHVFTDSKVALRDAVTRPSKRLSSWELLNLAEKDRALKAELDRQRTKEQMEQREKTYER